MRYRFSWITLSGFILLLLGSLATALWWWGGRASSLHTTLEVAAFFLPPHQRLEFEGATGSLWRGGRIDQLRWTDSDLQVQAHGLVVQWDLSAVGQHKLVVPRLAMTLLRIDDQRPPAPMKSPADAYLPLQLEVEWDIGAIDWVSSPTVRVVHLKGHYGFDGVQHRVDVHQATVASGTYVLHAKLQAHSPMNLLAELSGSVQTRIPQRNKPLTVEVEARLNGSLGLIDAAMDLQVRLTPANPLAPKDAMRGELQARISPWRGPWVTQAQAQWHALDLAALWPSAPATLLDGSGEVEPQNDGWRAHFATSNRHSGSWGQQRLPIEELNASATLLQGRWTIEALQATVGTGRVELKGRYTTASDWAGRATIRGVSAALVDPRWDAVPVDGELVARQTPEGIAFDTQLRARTHGTATRMGTRPTGLLFQQLQAHGLWAQPALRIEGLELALSDAQLRGSLQVDTRLWAGSTKVDGAFPGAQWHAQGSLSKDAGKGEAQVEIIDAHRAWSWIQRLGVGATGLGSSVVQGALKATAQWSGGWKENGSAMEVQTIVEAASMEVGSRPESRSHWRIADVRASLSGRPSALTLAVNGRAEQNSMVYGLKAGGQVGRTNDGRWDATVQLLELGAFDQTAREQWQLQLDRSFDLGWKSDPAGQVLNVGDGSAHLTGPAAGAVQLAWTRGFWTRRPAVVNGAVISSTRWNSQGRIGELSLDWLTHLARHDGLRHGMVGDLVFGGNWVAAGQDQELSIQATMKRTRGDLQVNADDANPNLEAGVRDAQVSLVVANDQVDMQLLWASANAGTLQASGSTRLDYVDGVWSWPSQAPVLGQLRAQLPRLGGWSMLAPPGWRLRGTLDASADLSGTRQSPVWKGTLKAKELSVRSVVDGIDFSQGTMRLELAGDGLEIADFRLQGASSGAASGGMLSLAGKVHWPGAADAAQRAAQWRMDVQATAEALRVSARADRRLVISGKVAARLDANRLDIEGSLVADQGAFTQAQDAAPVLDSDVRIGTVGATAGDAMPRSTRSSFVLGQSIEPHVQVTLDLGPRFQVEGYGLRSRLEGKLVLSSAKRDLTPMLHGEIRTVDGTYKAYGQQLGIEEGVVRFAGPYDNPTLEILAIRPNLTQRVGVQVSGTALTPSVRLYADPELPDAEKLSWLVVGHANADGSAQMALLQQAAMAAMSRSGQPWSTSLANNLGLDEISMSGLGTNGDSSANAGATLRIGKRIAGNFYVAYERSVAGAFGTFSIFYDLSKHLTLRGQTGEQSAADLIYTTRYD